MYYLTTFLKFVDVFKTLFLNFVALSRLIYFCLSIDFLETLCYYNIILALFL